MILIFIPIIFFCLQNNFHCQLTAVADVVGYNKKTRKYWNNFYAVLIKKKSTAECSATLLLLNCINAEKGEM